MPGRDAKCIHNFGLQTLNGRNQSEDLVVDVNIILE